MTSVFIFLMSLVTLWNQNQNKVYSSQYELKCPPSNEKTRKVLEYYVLRPHWSDKRVEIGTSSLVASDIEVLTSIVDGQVCTYLNSLYSSTINEKWPDNSPAYHVSFFKAGDFYFVSIAVAQPADPEWMSVGLSMIDVFDTSLNKLAGYSF